MKLLYRLFRFFFRFLLPWIEYVMFILIFPPGIGYRIAKWYYEKYFDSKIRQKGNVDQIIAQNKKEIWQNSQVVGQKRRPMHTYSHSFASSNLAISYWKERCVTFQVRNGKDGNLIYLTGKCGEPTIPWKFLLIGNPYLSPEDWNCSSLNDSKWKDVCLPNHWQLQGYDIPLYTNTAYPFRFDPPNTVRDGSYTNTLCDLGLGGTSETTISLHKEELGGWNTTGLFRKHFTIPKEWSQLDRNGRTQRIFLVFEGIDSNATIWLNDEYVGYSQDSCLSCEFEITNTVLFPGENEERENLLAVKVNRWCDGSYLEDQDKWWLSGIYREVYLVCRPSIFIADFEYHISPVNSSSVSSLSSLYLVSTALIEGYDETIDYRLKFQAQLWNDDMNSMVTSCSSASFIKSDDGLLLQRKLAEQSVPSESADQTLSVDPQNHYALVSIEFIVEDPLLWSAELPSLYTLLLILSDESSETEEESTHEKEIHIESCRIGFRTVSIDGPSHNLNVNHQPLVIAGVNRHEFSPYTGRSVSISSMIQDLLLLKSLNFNAIRCSHYPQHPYWLELCNELGFYVIDEANIETHGFQSFGQPIGYLSEQKEWSSAMLSRVTRMYERDKNFPCIIGWSLGNESGYGMNHRLMFQWLKARDPLNSRFIQYESGGATTDVTDIICPMYLKPSWCIDQEKNDLNNRPVILCEYAHAMGNSGGALHKYWGIFWDSEKHPRIQGGFIWDFVDQGLLDPSDLKTERFEQESRSNEKRSEEMFKSRDHNGKKRGRYLYGGDFGDYPNTHHFCCNGIVTANRYLLPSCYEVQNLQCPIHLKVDFLLEKKVNGSSSKKEEEEDDRSDYSRSGKSKDTNVNDSDVSVVFTIQNRRSFLSLDDIQVVITCQYHLSLFQEKSSLTPIIVSCHDLNILPDKFIQKEITQEIREMVRQHLMNDEVLSKFREFYSLPSSPSSSHFPSASPFSFTSLIHTRHCGTSGGLNELTSLFFSSWLDVSIVKKEGTSKWNNKWSDNCKEIELGHFSYESSYLSSLFKQEYEDLLEKESSFPQFLNLSSSSKNYSISMEIVTNSIDSFVLSANDGKISIVFNKMTGQLVEYCTMRKRKHSFLEKGKNGLETSETHVDSDGNGNIFIRPVDICCYRAVTDNDMGGSGVAYASQWKEAGYHCLKRKSDGELPSFSWKFNYEKNICSLSFSFVMIPSPDKDDQEKLPVSGIELLVFMNYMVYSNGVIDIEMKATFDSCLPPLPRFGFRFSVDSKFDSIRWFGLGPHEAYDDRKKGVSLGIYEKDIDFFHSPYIFPQENGRRAAPRFVLCLSFFLFSLFLSLFICFLFSFDSLDGFCFNLHKRNHHHLVLFLIL
jgi:beta-galactosidase/beta-glucuronidase